MEMLQSVSESDLRSVFSAEYNSFAARRSFWSDPTEENDSAGKNRGQQHAEASDGSRNF